MGMSTQATWKRKILYDASAASPEEVCNAVGLPPSSPDVEQCELAESEVRTQRVTPCLGAIEFVSASLAEVYATCSLPDELPNEIRQQIYVNTFNMLNVGLATGVSLLLDEGFLKLKDDA